MQKLRLNVAELVILEALRRQDNQYGLQLKTNTEAILNSERSLGGLYTTLHRLEQKKLVMAKWEDGQNPGGARRRFYKLTHAGRKTCEDMRILLNGILAG